MGDLLHDTEIEPLGDGLFRATLAPDWQTYGPNGGYLAALALRAVGRHTSQPRPASMSGQFLRIGRAAPADIRVRTLRTARRAECLRVSVEQRGAVIFEATVWAVAEGLAGPRRAWTPPPPAPPAGTLPSVNDRLAADNAPRLAIADTCIDSRPAEWASGGTQRPAGEPVLRGWIRFRDRPGFTEDVWLDFGRAAFVVDIEQFAAATLGLPAAEATFFAPTLDLYVAFHEPAPHEEWLLVEARGMSAADGLIGGSARVWTADGRLVASGGSQMLCRQ
jgi:acyl-CoA thioesterase